MGVAVTNVVVWGSTVSFHDRMPVEEVPLGVVLAQCCRLLVRSSLKLEAAVVTQPGKGAVCLGGGGEARIWSGLVWQCEWGYASCCAGGDALIVACIQLLT